MDPHTLQSCLAMLTVVLVAGCNLDPRLGAKVSELEAANKELQQEVAQLKVQMYLSAFSEVAFLKPGSDGYTTVRFDLGVLTVKIADVQPYANGSKVALQFGNLTSAQIDGLSAALDWGRVDAKGAPINDAAKSREVSFSESLADGSWTVTQLVLEGIPPAELGFVRLRNVSHRGVRLKR
jgi:hypothetical protein